MSHHYVQQLAHVIWSTRRQQFRIPQPITNQLYAYLSTLIRSKEGRLYLAGGQSDHIHCLLSLPPNLSMAMMMQFLKSSSSKWMKYQQLVNSEFSWEDGYTAISIQHDRINSVCAYINDEERRHGNINYHTELSKILQLHNIQCDEKYILCRSHSKLLIHMIWSTKNRIPCIEKSIRPSLYQVMTETVSRQNSVVQAIGGVEDHIHLLIEISRNTSLSELVKEIKGAGLRWLLAKGSSFYDFEWQVGYGAFTISISAISAVKQYIMQQEEHHKISSYTTEWNELILKSGLIS